MNRRARLAVATVLVGLGFGLVCASGASALTINGCEIKPGTQCPGADLSGADLNYAQLQGANLSGAKLHGTRLNHANLTSANLSGVKAHGAHFNFADLGQAGLQGSDLTGSNFYSAKMGKADFTSANVSGVNFVHAHFHETRFRQAKIAGADVIPSDIDGDHWARHYFFLRVYTHVNAYGSHGDCTGTKGVTCTGVNDDPHATGLWGHGVVIRWGSFEDRHNTFSMWTPHSPSDQLIGRTNSNLGDFYVDRITGAYRDFQNVGPTETAAPRGHPGGPIALGIHHHGGFSPGYSINVSGWLPRTTDAPHSGP